MCSTKYRPSHILDDNFTRAFLIKHVLVFWKHMERAETHTWIKQKNSSSRCSAFQFWCQLATATSATAVVVMKKVVRPLMSYILELDISSGHVGGYYLKSWPLTESANISISSWWYQSCFPFKRAFTLKGRNNRILDSFQLRATSRVLWNSVKIFCSMPRIRKQVPLK